MPKTSVRLPDGSYAQIVEWFDTDAFQASFCFEPHVPAVQVKSKTWRPQVDTLLSSLTASYGGFNNDLDVLFELELFGKNAPTYRVPLFAANGRPFAVPLLMQREQEFTLRALANVVFDKTCVIKAFLTAAQPNGLVCNCDSEHLTRYPDVHLSACPLFKCARTLKFVACVRLAPDAGPCPCCRRHSAIMDKLYPRDVIDVPDCGGQTLDPPCGACERCMRTAFPCAHPEMCPCPGCQRYRVDANVVDIKYESLDALGVGEIALKYEEVSYTKARG